jgi:4-amino-4-deoxy-L-arabinose transferase-like glycosyltransferase
LRANVVRPVALHARSVVGLVLLVLLGSAIRAYRVTDQPVFMDEDIHTQAVLHLDRVSRRSIARLVMEVGKPPLPFVSQAVLTRAVGDAVTAGRLQSAAGGVATIVLTYFLGRRLAGGLAGAGFVAASMYALSPVAVLHERMVLQDGLLTPAALGAVLVSWSAVERADARRALLAGALGALAVQIKVPGVGTAAAPLLVLVATPPATRRRVLAAAIAAMGPLLCYFSLRLSPLWTSYAIQDQERVKPFSNVHTNLQNLWDSAQTYVPGAVWLLIAVGIVCLVLARPRYLWLVLGMLAVWILPWPFISNFDPSRYNLPGVPYLAALAGVGAMCLISGLNRKPAAAGLATVAVIGALAASAALSVGVSADLRSARLTRLDDWQYRSGWPSGGAYASAAELVASTSDVDGRIYMVDSRHLIGAGGFNAAPGRAWVVSKGNSLPSDARGDVFVILDNVGLNAAGEPAQESAPVNADESDTATRLADVRQAAPGARVVGYFAPPGSNLGVAVLRAHR